MVLIVNKYTSTITPKSQKHTAKRRLLIERIITENHRAPRNLKFKLPTGIPSYTVTLPLPSLFIIPSLFST